MKVKVKVEKVDDKEVSLKINSGKNITLPLECAPKDIKNGDEYIFSIYKEGEENKDDKQVKDILNELLCID